MDKILRVLSEIKIVAESLSIDDPSFSLLKMKIMQLEMCIREIDDSDYPTKAGSPFSCS